MMNVSEHGNFAALGQLHWVIDQRPSFVLIFSFNIFLAFTATLGNTLILIALYKVSSIHPPTKFLLRCLAMSDFCVGVIDWNRKWKLACYLLDFEFFLTSPSVDFLSQQPLPLAWTGFSRCYWD